MHFHKSVQSLVNRHICAYPMIITFHDITFLLAILSNSSSTLSMVPHFAYMSTSVVANTTSAKISLSLMLWWTFQSSHLAWTGRILTKVWRVCLHTSQCINLNVSKVFFNKWALCVYPTIVAFDQRTHRPYLYWHIFKDL